MHDAKGFLKYQREDVGYRDVKERTLDWRYVGKHEVKAEFYQQQASRCMDCGVPFCQSNYGCPVENLIPDWNDLVANGKWREAYQSLASTNNFPEFTGYLCPAPCEAGCVLSRENQPVTIKQIEAEIIDRAFKEGWVEEATPAKFNGLKIAIVGSGPAGLAAAQQLVRLGYGVTVFEKAIAVGGLLRFGIPDFKFEKVMLDRRIEQLQKEGVQFCTGMELGVNLDLRDLNRDYSAVLLAIGAEAKRELPLPGRDLSGIYQAMDYLTWQNQVVSGVKSSNPIDV